MSKILVVDDMAVIREPIAAALRSNGYEAVCAGDGKEALTLVRQSPPPDLIVLDLRLPILDGVGFMRVLRSYLRWQHIPVIVVSAGTDTELEHVQQLGACGVFRKAQFQLNEFLDAVHDALAPASGEPNTLHSRRDEHHC